jgi:GNAT superfamily N-acetyltransferase
MWWRATPKDFEKNKGAGNKRAMKKRITTGEIPGILAYHAGEPVGWCSVAPREEFPSLARSRILAPADDKTVWSVTCLFVRRDFRRQGISVRLLNTAARYVAACGGRIVEGYPVDPKTNSEPDAFMSHGLSSAFEQAQYREVIRRSPKRPIMRRVVRPPKNSR